MTSLDQFTKNKANLDNLMSQVLKLVGALTITSTKRSPQQNTQAGGVPNSDHQTCSAADWVPIGMTCEQAFELIYKANLDYRQLILERKGKFVLGVFTGWTKWIHIAVNNPANAPKHEPSSQSVYGDKKKWFAYKGNGVYWA